MHKYLFCCNCYMKFSSLHKKKLLSSLQIACVAGYDSVPLETQGSKVSKLRLPELELITAASRRVNFTIGLVWRWDPKFPFQL